MQIPKVDIEAAYQRNASSYDFAVKFLYPLIGLRINKYRRRAVKYLNPHLGDTIVDVGCGTGLCFPLLMKKIGPKGKLIGVDISSEMLFLANERVKRAGWANVELVQSDTAKFQFPEGVNGVISTGVFGYIQERREVIENISNILADGGRLVIVDGKLPSNWPTWLFKGFVKLSSPFGLTEDYFNNYTWRIVEMLFENTTFEEVYGGLLYISSGEIIRTRPNH